MVHETPAERHLRLAAATLEDKFTALGGHAFMTGIQALIRLLINQRLRDRAAGRNTAGFVSGYRGSPLGPLDKELWKAQKYLQGLQIRFQPGINEELAATAVMGSQQLGLFEGARHEGVFGLWYGKGPGVDRCADVFTAEIRSCAACRSFADESSRPPSNLPQSSIRSSTTFAPSAF